MRPEAPLLQKRRSLPGAYGVTLCPCMRCLPPAQTGCRLCRWTATGRCIRALTRYAARLAVTDTHAFWRIREVVCRFSTWRTLRNPDSWPG